MRLEVDSPDGRHWTVRRRWLPKAFYDTTRGRIVRHVRLFFRRTGDVADLDPGCAGCIGDELVGALLAVVVVALLVVVVVPLLLAVVDVVIALALALGAIAGRLLFHRPWLVEATGSDGAVVQRDVAGWARSAAAVRELAKGLQLGLLVPPPPPADLPPWAGLDGPPVDGPTP